LNRDDARQVVLIGQVQIAHDAKGGFVTLATAPDQLFRQAGLYLERLRAGGHPARYAGSPHLVAAVKQAVRVLNRDDARQVVLIGQVQIAHDAKDLDLYQVHWPQRQTNCFGKLGYTWSDSAPVVTLLAPLRSCG
jgi:exonuclease III